MPKGFARIAAASVPMHLGNVAANVKEIQTALRKLENHQVQVALFPELCLTGATLGDLFLRQDLCQLAWQGLEALAEATGDMAVVVGLPVRRGGRVYNCAAVLHSGCIQGLIPKTDLTVEDARWFCDGADLSALVETAQDETVLSAHQLFETPDFTFGVVMGGACEASVSLSQQLIHQGADILLRPAASAVIAGSQEALCQELRQQSLRWQAGCAYACAGFGESTADSVFDGFTGVYELGDALAEGARFCLDGGMAIADIDVERLRYQRARTGSLRRMPVHQPCEVVSLFMPAQAPLPLLRPIDATPFIPKGSMAQTRLNETVSIQCLGLMTRLKALRSNTLVIGVSGGLDSTLALLIAARSFDLLGLNRKGIHAITMPGMGTGVRTKTNADRLMEALGVTALEIPIGPAVQQHFRDIGQPDGVHDVTYENSQARERTQILMDYANKVNAIVLGTGDLSEGALGFCTYNGDHMSMYNVNGSIPKTLVKHLVRKLGGEFGGEAGEICCDVADTPISPELLPVTEGELNQKTEDILGDYALHDFFLYHFVTGGASREKLQLLANQAFQGVYDAEKIAAQLTTFLRRFQTQQFKRNCVPDGPCAGPVSLSPRGAWRMPSDMGPIL